MDRRHQKKIHLDAQTWRVKNQRRSARPSSARKLLHVLRLRSPRQPFLGMTALENQRATPQQRSGPLISPRPVILSYCRPPRRTAIAEESAVAFHSLKTHAVPRSLHHLPWPCFPWANILLPYWEPLDVHTVMVSLYQATSKTQDLRPGTLRQSQS